MAQGKDFYIPFQDGSGRIHGICWEPEETPWAVIQVAHGMIEHIGRYEEFAQAMNRAGIAVIGHDHPGHGRTAKPGELGEFAEKNGVRRVNGAMAQVARFAKHKFQGIPHILLGHSMGSFFGRRFITHYGEWLDGAIFMGTGSQPEPLLWLGGTVVAAAAWLEGRNGRNERLHQLVLGSYNHYFEKGKTEHQWLSRVTEEDEKYEADPYCQFLFTDGAFVDFFQVMLDLKRKRGFDGIPKNLPILLISGEEGRAVADEVNHLVTENLFTTITNANFDKAAIEKRIEKTLEMKTALWEQLERRDNLPEAAGWTGEPSEFIKKASEAGVLIGQNEDIISLRSLITYGLKGLSAYTRHANVLLQEDREADAFLQRALAATLDDGLSVDDLIHLTLETGEYGVRGMALLDRANTETYGNPEITTVDIGVGSNPGILVSGHDLRDMEMLLEQTQGTGVDVYTHSEMLPAQYYPAFKKYPNFKGNYGNAWWRQKEEFETFNGPILMTTNCIVPPKDSYKDRLYTTGAAGYPGCTYINGGIGGKKDFSVIIQHAKRCEPPTGIEQGQIVGGFAHAQVLALADKVVDAVKSGKIRKFVVMAGCDGRAKSRIYYTDFAKALPEDTVILTAGCAKYRYNKLNLGDIEGIPRVLDAGQCNDSYSLAVIAMKLQEIFGLDDINDLPIIYNIAWYEQKAVIVLLALLSLGIKNIHLGPTLPAFLSPNVVNVLVEKFGIAGIDSVESDVELFFGEK